MFVRKTPRRNHSPLALYDWESCCIHVPQRDVAWFLILALEPSKSPAESLATWRVYTDYYRQELLRLTELYGLEQHNSFKDTILFDRVLDFQVFEVFCNRICNWILFPPNVMNWPHREGMRKFTHYIEAVAPILRFV